MSSVDPGRESALVFSRDLLANMLLPLPMLASTAVAWHQLMIQGRSDISRVYLDLGPPVRRYMLIALGFQLLVLAPVLIMIWWFTSKPAGAVVVSILVGCLGTILALVGFVVTCRLSMLLPATAIDAPASSLPWAWSIARGATWRLLVGSVVTALLGLVPIFAFTIGADEILPPLGPVAHAIKEAVGSLLSNLVFAVPMLSFLSLSYRHLVPLQAEEPDSAR